CAGFLLETRRNYGRGFAGPPDFRRTHAGTGGGFAGRDQGELVADFIGGCRNQFPVIALPG
ncbi:hypothetical protein, partial [Nocardia inohanensis]|uniref:hypothetical protein n=1 Tax=Nocardia inohanensis TaxID=209246 RepID=UPI001C3F61FB